MVALHFYLALLSGVLNGIAFIYFGAFALIANVPLLYVLHREKSLARSMFFGGVTGFIGGLHIYGIASYGIWILIAFALYTASQMVLYAALFCVLKHRRAWLDLLLPAALWMLTEWVRTLGPVAMPASYVGCLVEVSWLRPWKNLIPILGGLGVSGLCALFQSVVYEFIFQKAVGKNRVPQNSKRAFAALGFIALTGVLGVINPPSVDGRALQVAAVQGGLPNAVYEAARIDALAMRDMISTYEILTQRAYASGAELVIWPETAVRAPVLQSAELKERLLPAKDSHSILVAGLLREGLDQTFNSAAAIAAGGNVIDITDKIRLVPGTESDLTPGIAHPLQTPIGKLGVLICLESVFPDLGRSQAIEGAEILIVISNDAGFGRSPITKHMTNRARVRALETGRWLVRAGQAGLSVLIDPKGDIQSELDLFESGVLVGQVALRTSQTPYTRFGPWPLALVFIVLIVTFFSKRRVC